MSGFMVGFGIGGIYTLTVIVICSFIFGGDDE